MSRAKANVSAPTDSRTGTLLNSLLHNTEYVSQRLRMEAWRDWEEQEEWGEWGELATGGYYMN